MRGGVPSPSVTVTFWGKPGCQSPLPQPGLPSLSSSPHLRPRQHLSHKHDRPALVNAGCAGAGLLRFQASFAPSHQSSSCQEQSSSRVPASCINPVKQFTDLTPTPGLKPEGMDCKLSVSLTSLSAAEPRGREGPRLTGQFSCNFAGQTRACRELGSFPLTDVQRRDAHQRESLPPASQLASSSRTLTRGSLTHTPSVAPQAPA